MLMFSFFVFLCGHLQIALFVSSSDAVQPGWLVNYLKGIDSKRIREMQANLAKVCLLLCLCTDGAKLLNGFFFSPLHAHATMLVKFPGKGSVSMRSLKKKKFLCACMTLSGYLCQNLEVLCKKKKEEKEKDKEKAFV